MRLILLVTLGALALAAPAFAGDLREARGVLTSVSRTSVSVRGEHATVSCRVGEHTPALADFSPGDRVVVVCARADNAWKLVRIRHLAPPPSAPTAPAPEVTATQQSGSVSALSSSSLTLRDGDQSLTCSLGEHSPSVAGVAVGDHVRVACTNGVLTKLERFAPPDYGAGAVVALSSDSISVHGEHDLTCALGPQSPSVANVHVGDRVKVACVAGKLVGVARIEAPVPPPPAPAPVPVATQSATGTISALNAGSVSIHGEHDVTCSVGDSSPHLGDFRVGDRVRVGCANGVLVSIARL